MGHGTVRREQRRQARQKRFVDVFSGPLAGFRFEGVDGVARPLRVEGLAGFAHAVQIEQEVDVTIEQSRIDVVNSAILEDIDKELAKVERQLNDAQAQISDGKRQLANGKAMAYEQLKQAEDALKNGETQITPAIEQMTAQRDALQAQRDQLAQAVEAMEAAENMTDEQKAAVQMGAQQLAALRQQKAALEQQLADIESGEGGESDNSALVAQRQLAQATRDQLAAQRDAQKAYIEDLKLMDADALSAEIAQLNQEIADAETALDADKAELSRLVLEQKRILEGSAGLVKPGGRLVYSTCSILDKENGEIIRKFLKENRDFYLDYEEQMLPDENRGCDGFYIAVLIKERRPS